MDKQTILERIKDIIACISFKLFLWSTSMTKENYWNEIYEQEKREHESDKEE